jgi:hypothetical protein
MGADAAVDLSGYFLSHLEEANDQLRKTIKGKGRLLFTSLRARGSLIKTAAAQLMNQHLLGIVFPKLVYIGRGIDCNFDGRRACEIEV